MMMIDDVTVSGAADSATSRVRWSCSDVIISVKTRSHSTATKNLKITHYSMNVTLIVTLKSILTFHFTLKFMALTLMLSLVLSKW